MLSVTPTLAVLRTGCQHN